MLQLSKVCKKRDQEQKAQKQAQPPERPHRDALEFLIEVATARELLVLQCAPIAGYIARGAQSHMRFNLDNESFATLGSFVQKHTVVNSSPSWSKVRRAVLVTQIDASVAEGVLVDVARRLRNNQKRRLRSEQ